MKIACIGDEDTVALLRLAGASHCVVADDVSRQFDELVKNEDINFILLDVMMEEVDTGCRIADEINKVKSDVPVVILSSFADAAKQTFDVGSVPVKEYLQKPLKSDELLAVVKKYT